MSPDTCIVLAQVFPVLLLGVALEGRYLHRNLVKLRLFRALGSLTSGLVGTGAAIVGVQLGGIEGKVAWLLWLLLGVAIVCTGVFLTMAVASTEAAAENEPVTVEPLHEPVTLTRLDLFADFIRGRRST